MLLYKAISLQHEESCLESSLYSSDRSSALPNFFLFIRWQTRCSSRFCHFDCDNTHLGSHPCLFTLQVKTKFFWTIATFLAIIGVVLINSAGTSSGEAIGWALLLPILAGLSYAVEIIFIGQVVKNISPENAMLLEMSFVSLLLLPVIFFYPLDWIFTTQGILVSLGLGVITAGIAFPCFVGGLKLTSPIVAATLALTEPLMATALGIFFLHEPITMNMSIGIVCLISAVAVLVFENKKG